MKNMARAGQAPGVSKVIPSCADTCEEISGVVERRDGPVEIERSCEGSEAQNELGMDVLSAEARALIDAAAGSHDPTPQERESVLRGVLEKVGIPLVEGPPAVTRTKRATLGR